MTNYMEGLTMLEDDMTLMEIELARFDGPGDAFDRPTKGEPPRRA